MPGFNRPSAFAATASTVSARCSGRRLGDTKRTLASKLWPGYASTDSETGRPGLISETDCSGMVSSSRSGSTRTTVATRAPRVT